MVLHGGPGAPGYMAPVCRYLAPDHRVIEPFQRMRTDAAVTVATHVEDLHRVIESVAGEQPVTLVGHSWGAMLALAYGAEHPDCLAGLILVGCGTFDVESRQQLHATVAERMSPALKQRLTQLSRATSDADVRMCVTARLLKPLYSFELLPHADETEWYDSRGQQESWSDMLRLQQAGVYPAAFAAIHAPALLLHGDVDPHPGRRVASSLQALLPRLEHVELPRCGHYPWWERHARDVFYRTLGVWLASHAP
jgi:pimeloyl-ACP methyl ester carboxylesterase